MQEKNDEIILGNLMLNLRIVYGAVRTRNMLQSKRELTKKSDSQIKEMIICYLKKINELNRYKKKRERENLEGILIYLNQEGIKITMDEIIDINNY